MKESGAAAAHCPAGAATGESGSLSTRTPYIPAIDGLRAVAVLAVMVYHAVPHWLPGGYAGVDVFFVISGYLITRIILAERIAGTFRLVHFWERRARRILPPVVVLLAITGAVAWAWFTPRELTDFAASAAASLISAANIYFWQTSSGYFGVGAAHIPLLHLWSLGVEEQFYLVYPPLLLLVGRFRREWLLPLLVLGILLSLGLSIYTATARPLAGFYLPFSRAWELAAGCALASWQRGRGIGQASPAAEWGWAACIATLFATFILVTDASPWPGLSTVPAIVATAGLIQLAPISRWSTRWLACRPAVQIGLASYGAYLWHHAFLAFAKILSPQPVVPGIAICLVALSLVAGALSYVFIESPVRDRGRVPSRVFWPSIIVATGALLLVFTSTWLSGGAPQRLPQDLQRLEISSAAYISEMSDCLLAPAAPRTYQQACMRGRSGPVRTVIVGDSHAAALAPGLDPLLNETGTRARILASGGCPFIEDPRALSEIQSHCPQWIRSTVARVARDKDVRLVVIASRWPYAFDRTYYDNGEGGIENGYLDQSPLHSRQQDLIERSIARLVNELRRAGKTVVLVHSVPEPGWDLPKYLVRRHLFGRPPIIPTIDESRWRKREGPARSMIDRLAAEDGVGTIDPAAMTCGGSTPGRCRLGQSRTLYYFDDDHPSIEGARRMIDGFLRKSDDAEALADLIARPLPSSDSGRDKP